MGARFESGVSITIIEIFHILLTSFFQEAEKEERREREHKPLDSFFGLLFVCSAYSKRRSSVMTLAPFCCLKVSQRACNKMIAKMDVTYHACLFEFYSSLITFRTEQMCDLHSKTKRIDLV